MVNPRVFFDIQIGTIPAGRITIELFPEHAPKACKNFLTLCRGTKPPVTIPGDPDRIVPLTYRGSIFHRVIAEFMLQGGDITNGNGTGGLCALDDHPPQKAFEDENLGWREIDAPGLVCMANRGPGTNTSQFFITLDECTSLTPKHTLFGKVVGGLAVVKQIGEVNVNARDRPLQDVIIAECGEVEFRGKKYVFGSEWDDAEEGVAEKRQGGHKDPHSGQPGGPGGGAAETRSRGTSSVAPDHDAPTDADDAPRGRSRTPVPTDPLSPIKSKTKSPEQRRHRHHHHHRRRRSRSPLRHHSRSPRRYRNRSRSRHRRHHYNYTRDDPQAEERILREERERESQRKWEPIPDSGEVKFKGRGTMRYRERKQWGGGGGNSTENYGRLN
ncbi:cyclophilin-like domain-containing protein [Trichophaea hybrida]|nr:cyclophilin-like domain-containing protein [Trichophaea hybrida]